MAPPDPSVIRIDGPWRHLDVHANGIRFHVVEAQRTWPSRRRRPAPTRPLVILLHGFGSFWWSWRHQLRGLTGARVVAVDLRGYGGSDKPPRGYDGWTLAGDTAGLIRALGHTSATLVGHADGGLVCWATSVLHPRLVRAIAVVSSPHPVALRASALTRRDQGRALLPSMLRYQVPIWPERSLTRHDADELERLVRSRASGKWLASEDFSETIGHLRRAIQIPSAAHSRTGVPALGGAQPAARRGPAVHAVDEPAAGVPVLHMRGDADPYVLADPVDRTQHYAPHGRYVSIAGAGHFGHEEAPEVVNEHLSRFLDAGVRLSARSADAGRRWRPRCGVADLARAGAATSLAVSTKPVSASSTAAPNTTPSTLPVAVDHRATRITLPHSASDGVHLAGHRWRCGRCRGR